MDQASVWINRRYLTKTRKRRGRRWEGAKKLLGRIQQVGRKRPEKKYENIE